MIYLQQLHNKHETWMKQNIEKGMSVLILDADENLINDKKIKIKYMEQIKIFIKNLKNKL